MQGSHYPGDVKKAIFAEFKQRFTGVDPDQVVLKLEGSNEALEPKKTLTDARIQAGTTLVVELTAAVTAPTAPAAASVGV